MSDKLPHNPPQAPRLVREAVHKAWMRERPASYRKADTRLKIIFLAWAGLTMGAAAVGASVGPQWLIFAGAIACVVGGGIIIGLAQRYYRRGLMAYFHDRLDEDKVLTLCAGCGYDLRGCKPPRRKCPACGKATWTLGQDG